MLFVRDSSEIVKNAESIAAPVFVTGDCTGGAGGGGNN